jgi:heterodisulfide reductase subunit A
MAVKKQGKNEKKNAADLAAPVGAVLVMGGGVGGIQASLELANMGYKVYLTDSSPSVGGVMGMLDKTFPTNECSMCILSPKMVEVASNINVEVITLADERALVERWLAEHEKQ